MARSSFESVDEYIAAQPDAVQETLHRVRSAIRKAVPEATETISYQMPAYKLQGEALIYFAAWKQHFSLYPATRLLIKTFAAELAPYRFQKATIRFPFNQPVPTKLIESLAKFRKREIAGQANARAAAPER